MVRRVTPSQFQSMVRQAQQKQQRAINDYNRAVRDHNAAVRRSISNYNRAIDSYNREVRAHNARVRENRRQLKTAMSRLQHQRTAVRSTTYYTSVQTLHQSYELVEEDATGTWLEARDDILDLAQRETANSLALAETAEAGVEDGAPAPADPEVERRLMDFGIDLAARWRGALFAIDDRNPDAARHFSTSCREILTQLIETDAPDDAVLAADPDAQLHDGRPTRRARLAYCLVKAGRVSNTLAAFADDDVQEVVELFKVFNDGTHGAAGIFDVRHLGLIRARVEGAVTFLHAILRDKQT